MTGGIGGFGAATAAWFEGAFEAPTPVQRDAWAAIGRGEHALIVAPTGSGKTLAAFLSAIDRLAHEAPGESAGVRVLYVSPLKALGVDVEKNLRAPLAGIQAAAERLGGDVRVPSVGVRTGDTPQHERRRLATHPPDLLITTPETLAIQLTSGARRTLAGVEVVIVDEIHALAGTKRGADLALALERLDALAGGRVQRVGLSATVRPREEVARFLGGDRPVTIVAPTSGKLLDLRVAVPVEDLGDLRGEGGTVWPKVEEAITDEVLAHRSTIVFVNSRRVAERLTARLNEIVADRIDAETLAPSEVRPLARVGPGGEPDASEPVEGVDFVRPSRPDAPVPGGLAAIYASSANQTGGADPILARAHHGSVSKEERLVIESQLKSGELRCVVATSSLELGIDMGEVDLVVQLATPPSVASGLQRVGRAGHQVGEASRGVVFPQHRTDLLHAAVVAERMVDGRIEAVRVLRNPLDVLAQHTVAVVAALESVQADEWFRTVIRSAPFATLPRSAFDAVLDLLAGRYPSDRFAGLRPRLVWDRVTGILTPRPGAGRLAMTSGGTIPDRGLFGVFLAGEGAGRRVGELDEEMVYESRVGDVFALGTTSWRIQEITHDRVVVVPAAGAPGRVPFWKGDTLGRPAELGEAIGAYTRELVDLRQRDPDGAERMLAAGGLDRLATRNLVALVDAQREATGVVPDDRTLLVERFLDELGDWRIVLHSPYGLPVHAPWALAVGARIQERFGVDASAVAGDDGIVLRLPDTGVDPPGAELFRFDDADELAGVVASRVSDSALFASRFRECAARALLLPQPDPRRRAPLWQQRRRAAQLLDVAADYPDFPILLETARECLQDVYDLPALQQLARRIGERRVRIVETRTELPSPYAQALLFGYVGEFMYEGDQPLAERRAAALALDPRLLTELLGDTGFRDLFDADLLVGVERELQHLGPERRRHGIEGVADLLRELGPLTTDELAARLDPEDADEDADAPLGPEVAAALAAALEAAGRVIRVELHGRERWAAVEDAARLRDGLGTVLPGGIPPAFLEPVADPLGDLVGRFARTHGPFLLERLIDAYGVEATRADETLQRLARTGRVVHGEFTPGVSGLEWADADVLDRVRRRSLAALREQIEPVEPRQLARFLPEWQRVGPAAGGLSGVDGVLEAIEHLEGVRVPASALESLILPARVRDYRPALLDELTAAGEVVWAGAGELAGDGWISLHLADSAGLTLPLPEPVELGSLEQEVLAVLGSGGGYFFRPLAEAVGSLDDAALEAALWKLVWAGLVGNDTLAPVRALVAGGGAHRPKPRTPRVRGGVRRLPRPEMPARGGAPTAAGRWSALPVPDAEPTARAIALGETLLERYGVVTRGAVAQEGPVGGFELVYRTLSRLEEAGRVRRGYFVDGLGAAQFAAPAVVDRLRAQGPTGAIALAATDPANPYGAALPWPASPDGVTSRPARKAGAFVVLVDGALVCFVERGGRTVLVFDEEPAAFALAADALADLVLGGGAGRIRIERANGRFVLGTPTGRALEAAGFRESPQGLRLAARPG
ncbi:ATP-dependent helicase [Agromyces seonyuensis]|uniref:ATP-dependent helicase n=1 Tax=Agromyces seonyuensis TaxID=2662446 RepID=UPI0030148406